MGSFLYFVLATLAFIFGLVIAIYLGYLISYYRFFKYYDGPDPMGGEPIVDARILGLVGWVNNILKPEFPIYYYSIKTNYQKYNFPWIFFVNAFYLLGPGIKDTIYINDAALDNLSDEHLLFLIAHEVGHAKNSGYPRNDISLSHCIAMNFMRRFFLSKRYNYERDLKFEIDADREAVKCVGPQVAVDFMMNTIMARHFVGHPTDQMEDRLLSIVDEFRDYF